MSQGWNEEWMKKRMDEQRTDEGSTKQRKTRMRRMNPKKTKIAQVMISDFIVSLSVFMLVLMLFYVTWTRNVDAMGEELLRERALQAAQKGMDALTLSPGFPSNWAVMGLASPGDAALGGIGTAQSPGNLDEVKMAQLAAWLGNPNNHNATLKKMGIGPYDADVGLSLTDGGTQIYYMGYGPQSDAQVLASAQRLVVYANKSATVRIRVWRAGQ